MHRTTAAYAANVWGSVFHSSIRHSQLATSLIPTSPCLRPLAVVAVAVAVAVAVVVAVAIRSAPWSRRSSSGGPARSVIFTASVATRQRYYRASTRSPGARLTAGDSRGLNHSAGVCV